LVDGFIIVSAMFVQILKVNAFEGVLDVTVPGLIPFICFGNRIFILETI